MDWNVFGNLGAAFIFILGLVRIERRLSRLEGSFDTFQKVILDWCKSKQGG